MVTTSNFHPIHLRTSPKLSACQITGPLGLPNIGDIVPLGIVGSDTTRTKRQRQTSTDSGTKSQNTIRSLNVPHPPYPVKSRSCRTKVKSETVKVQDIKTYTDSRRDSESKEQTFYPLYYGWKALTPVLLYSIVRPFWGSCTISETLTGKNEGTERQPYNTPNLSFHSY